MPSDHPARPVRDGIVLGVATGVIGVVFGVVASAAGLSPARAAAMSLLVFTGASQFAAVGVISAGGTVGAALGAALLLAARNGLYGPVVARWLGGMSLPARLAAAQVVIDESTAVGAAQPDATDPPSPLARAGFFATGIAIYVCWNAGTVLGALVGTRVGDPAAFGLDAAFPAAFVALLLPHLRHRAGAATAGLAALIALLTIPVVPTGVPILLAALAVVPAGRWR